MSYRDRVEHKNPADRAHFWERPQRHDEMPAAPIDPNFPKHLHKADGEFLEVGDDDAMQRALDDGWALDPPAKSAE